MPRAKDHKIKPSTRWGWIIYRRMVQWNISQSDLARMLGIEVQRLNDWLHGRTEPSDYYRELLAARLELDPLLIAPDWMMPALMGHKRPDWLAEARGEHLPDAPSDAADDK